MSRISLCWRLHSSFIFIQFWLFSYDFLNLFSDFSNDIWTKSIVKCITLNLIITAQSQLLCFSLKILNGFRVTLPLVGFLITVFVATVFFIILFLYFTLCHQHVVFWSEYRKATVSFVVDCFQYCCSCLSDLLYYFVPNGDKQGLVW